MRLPGQPIATGSSVTSGRAGTRTGCTPAIRSSTRTTWHAGARLDGRRPARARRSFAATVAELAALWHLPGEPTQYGMTDTVAHTRPPGRELPNRWPRRNPDPGSAGWRDDEEGGGRDDRAA